MNNQTGSDELDEQLRVLSAKRKKYYFLSALFVIVTVICIVAAIWAAALVAFVIGVILLLLAYSCSRQAKGLVTGHIVQDTLAQVFDIDVYQKDSRIKCETITDSELFPEWSRDEFGHTHEDHYKNGSEILTRQWLVISAAMPLGHRVRILGRERRITGGYKKTESSVETENIGFNEQFQILADDAHTAFYILTPHFMEQILSADQRARGRTYMSFVGDRVHIAVDTGRNTFEVRRDAGNLPVLRERIKSEIKYITELMDELLQNDYLFNTKSREERCEI